MKSLSISKENNLILKQLSKFLKKKKWFPLFITLNENQCHFCPVYMLFWMEGPYLKFYL